MSRIIGTTTLSTNGLKTISLGFAPTWVTLSVCSNTGTDNVSHRSEGKAMVGAQFCQSTFTDTTGSKSFNSSSHVVRHYERSGGSIVPVLEAAFDSFTASGVKLNVTVANSNYQVLVEAGN